MLSDTFLNELWKSVFANEDVVITRVCKYKFCTNLTQYLSQVNTYFHLKTGVNTEVAKVISFFQRDGAYLEDIIFEKWIYSFPMHTIVTRVEKSINFQQVITSMIVFQ